MEHVAIDLGGRESQLCVRSCDGTILEEKRCLTRDLGTYLAKRPASRVILETCAEAFHVADRALELGHEVRVVPATLVRSLGVGARRTKTDKRDAQTLSEVSCRIDLPSVHIASDKSRELKTILNMREALVGARTKLINNVRGYLRGRAISIPRGPDAFFKAIDKLLEKKEATSVLESSIQRQLRMIKALTVEIEEANKETAGLAKRDPICPRLMSVPGIGPITALQYVACVDDVTRFKSSHHLEAYFGLTPGENSSSEHRQKLGITKAGSPAMRKYLVQAAWAARRKHGQHPMLVWTLEVEKRRGKRIAVVALARKLAGILFAIWRDGTTYTPKLSARPTTME
jgi:transposase